MRREQRLRRGQHGALQRRQPIQQLRARLISVAVSEIAGAVACDKHAPFPWVRPPGRAVEHAVDKEHRVASVEVYLDPGLDELSGAVFRHLLARQRRMGEVRFMAPWHNDGGAVVGAYISEGDDQAQLPAAELAVVVPEMVIATLVLRVGKVEVVEKRGMEEEHNGGRGQLRYVSRSQRR